MWGCEDVGQQMWGCEDVDQQMWRCEDVDQQMWGCEGENSRCEGRSADVRVWRCRSADVRVWRYITTAAFLRRTLRRRSREKSAGWALEFNNTWSWSKQNFPAKPHRAPQPPQLARPLMSSFLERWSLRHPSSGLAMQMQSDCLPRRRLKPQNQFRTSSQNLLRNPLLNNQLRKRPP